VNGDTPRRSDGDIISANITGSGNVVGKNINVGTISIGSEQLRQLPDEFAAGLKEFTAAVNRLLAEHKVAPELVAPVQESVTELAAEVRDVGEPEKLSRSKKSGIRSKLEAVAEGLLKALPTAAEVGAAFTPLAPFSKLVGTGIQQIVDAVTKPE